MRDHARMTRERDPEYRLGVRVREARGRLSMRAAAKKAGISVETLWQMEEGRRRDSKPWSRPYPDMVRRVARALGIAESEALTLAGYDPTRYLSAADDEPAVPSPPVLAEKLHHLDADDLRAIEHLVDSLLRGRGYIAADAPRPKPVESGVPEPARDGVEALPGSGPVGAPPVHEPSADQRRRSSIDNRRS